MMNESATMKEVMSIRLAVYEEIKDLSPEGQIAYFNDASCQMEQEYGIQFRRPADAAIRKAVYQRVV